ncbi:unnamed protein product [Lactuca virosa]|uniref:Reverse transcriptase zinc-binding domain-containing protein n=1 Tax=Lactuca virosa TaxID=75947 RepID=A0AAU9MLW7_9ASTR|nr:unnamed protein product [Lactuca virosa]
MDGEENEPEEGEFRPDQTQGFMGMEPTTEAQTNSGKTKPAPVSDSHADEPLGATIDPTVNVVAPPKVLESVEIPNSTVPASPSTKAPIVSLMGPNSSFGPEKNPILGPVENLVPLGCFGPFPTNNGTPIFSFTSEHLIVIQMVVVLNLKKRHWRSCPHEAGLTSELNNLRNDLSSVQLVNRSDTWESSLDKYGAFKVCDLRWKVDGQSGITQNIPTIKWSKEVPIKVNCFLWRAIQQRIASMTGLRARGIKIQTTMCGACINVEEDADHILVRCPFAKNVRDKTFNWCGIQNQSFNSIDELLRFAANWGRRPKMKARFHTICYGLVWNLWKYRNDQMFNQVFISPSYGVEQIKLILYMWVKCRGKGGIYSWVEWSSSPFCI